MEHVYEDYKDLHVRMTILYATGAADGVFTCYKDNMFKEKFSNQEEFDEILLKGCVVRTFLIETFTEILARPLRIDSKHAAVVTASDLTVSEDKGKFSMFSLVPALKSD